MTSAPLVFDDVREEQIQELTRPGVRAPVEDPAPDPAPRQPSTFRPAWLARRTRVVPVVVALLLFVGIWATRQRGGTAAPASESSSAIAVLPFAVHGAPEFAHLGEGMVDLLSVNLDGAGELRTVDPRALVSFVSADSSARLSPQRGREVAERFGADRYLLGDVVEANGRLRITAALYDRSRGPAPVARATVEGSATELFQLVDELTAKLLADQYNAPGQHLARSAAVASRSLPALKAYLEGEAHLRGGRYDAAVDAFERAIAADSSFALAFYRLSMAADWAGRLDRAVEVTNQAMHHRDRLSEHDRLLVEAYHAWRYGKVAEAEHLYRTVLDRHPDDVEAWYQLGEVLFHYNPDQGRSFTESRRPFERVLAFEPEHRGALVHLLRVAAYEEKRAELDTFLSRALAHTAPSEQLELRAFRVFTLGTQADQDRIVKELRAAAQDVLWHSAWRIAVYGRNIEGAERVARLLLDPGRPPQARTFGMEVVAALLQAKGQWRAARAEGDRVSELDRNPTKGMLVHFAALPLLPLDRPEIIQLRDWIARSDPDGSEPPAWFALGAVGDYGRLGPQMRVYAVGVLNARLGEVAEAETLADELETMGSTPEARVLARYLATVIRANVAHSQDRPRQALALLDRAAAIELPMDLADASGARGHAVWTRAEVLRELGRYEEAVAWYATRVQIAINEVIYLAPAHFRQGEIHERLGNREKAIEHYARFVELWENADPEFRPMLLKGQRRLARLRGQVAAR